MIFLNIRRNTMQGIQIYSTKYRKIVEMNSRFYPSYKVLFAGFSNSIDPSIMIPKNPNPDLRREVSQATKLSGADGYFALFFAIRASIPKGTIISCGTLSHFLKGIGALSTSNMT